jgi:hypothetical protein
MLRRALIGQGDDIEAHYVSLVKEDTDVAVLGNAYTSVTLAPNIQVDFEEGVSVIDMAGYEDKRDYVGVIGVSYFLKAVFERVREVKFVIVFDEHKFVDTTGDGMVKTFNGFINMFNIDKMTDDIKKSFYKSISLVVTRS